MCVCAYVHTYRLLREKKGKSTERRKETVELATSLLGSYIREAFQTPWLETHQLLLVVLLFFRGSSVYFTAAANDTQRNEMSSFRVNARLIYYVQYVHHY